jgi:hypothetical protein
MTAAARAAPSPLDWLAGRAVWLAISPASASGLPDRSPAAGRPLERYGAPRRWPTLRPVNNL